MRAVFLFIAILLLGACSTSNRIRPDTPLPERKSMFQDSILQEVQRLEKAHNCEIGLSFKDPDHDLAISHRADDLVHAASTMKIPVMIEVFRQADAGKFSINDEIKVDPMFESMIDGSPYETEPKDLLEKKIGQNVPILLLVEQMIDVSDNLATNLLIERCGTRRITATMRELGAKDGYVVRCLQDEESYQAGFSNRLTPNDLVTLVEAIENDKAANAESCAEMRRILLAQEYNDMISAQLPEGVKVGHKTGSITRHRHDAGVVYTDKGKYYLAIMTVGIENEEESSAMIAGLSRKIYDGREQVLSSAPE